LEPTHNSYIKKNPKSTPSQPHKNSYSKKLEADHSSYSKAQNRPKTTKKQTTTHKTTKKALSALLS